MDLNKAPNEEPFQQPLADDILRGADEIAEFIFGDRNGRRKVYYPRGMHETSDIPNLFDALRQALRALAVDFWAGRACATAQVMVVFRGALML